MAKMLRERKSSSSASGVEGAMTVYVVPVRLNLVMYFSTLSLWTTQGRWQTADGTAEMWRAQREANGPGEGEREGILGEYNDILEPGQETRLTGSASPASHLDLSAATSM